MTSWNGLHKLPIVIFGKAPKTSSLVFELRHQKLKGDEQQNKKLLNIFGSLKSD